MKAYVLHGIGDLRYEDVAEPQLQEDWVLVKVAATGICSSDIPRIFTKGTYHFPTIPCHEFSGVVARVRDEKHAHLLNRKVGIFPLIPCRKCKPCEDGRYEMCKSYDYIGSRRDGAFAEYVAVPVWNLLPLPDNTDMKTAAMLEPLAVALHAVKKLDVQPGDRVAVIGTGMIGFAAAQWALAKGAGKVCVVGRSMKKKEIADNLPGVDYMTLDMLKDDAFDRAIEAVGTADSICATLRAVGAGGTVVLMGNPAGDIAMPQDVYWKILRKQLTVVGTWNSSYEKDDPASDWAEALQAIANGNLDASGLITHCYPHDRLMDALELMRTHSQSYCKVMVEWNGGI